MFHKEYTAIRKDMIEKSYAVKIPEFQLICQDGKLWYVPHHGVYHPQKGTLRVVFDCTASYKGTSLNNELIQGPDLANSLMEVLLRSREEEVAVMAENEVMYHQVKVTEEDTDLMHFLWWPESASEQDMVEYKMTVHLFGATSSLPATVNSVFV